MYARRAFNKLQCDIVAGMLGAIGLELDFTAGFSAIYARKSAKYQSEFFLIKNKFFLINCEKAE